MISRAARRLLEAPSFSADRRVDTLVVLIQSGSRRETGDILRIAASVWLEFFGMLFFRSRV